MTGNSFLRMTKVAVLVIPALAVLLALPGTTYAQRMTGDLSGSVVDESGGVIPGADVTVINEASKGGPPLGHQRRRLLRVRGAARGHLHRPDRDRRASTRTRSPASSSAVG